MPDPMAGREDTDEPQIPKRQTRPQGVGYRKGNEVIVTRWKGHKSCKWRVRFVEDGKWRNRGFQTKKAATTWAETRQKETLASGTEDSISLSERAAVIDARNDLIALGVDLRDALSVGIEQLKQVKQSCTVSEAIARVITVAEENNKSTNHIQDLVSRLGRFETSFGERVIATVTKREVEDWIKGLKGLSKVTKKNYNASLRCLFAQAIEDKYIIESPAMSPKVFKEASKDAEVLTPADLATLLAKAEDQILPSILLAAFAGIRREEIEGNEDHRGLSWSDIKFQKQKIIIPAEIAKARRKRTIPISDNLASWLLPYSKYRGAVWPKNGRRQFDRAKRLAGFGRVGSETKEEKKNGVTIVRPWPANGLRHSFASYHLAKFENAPQLSLYMGNTPRMIFDHYDGAVEEEAAETYWKISPDGADNVVSIGQGAA